MSKIRIGIVGVGMMGQAAHLRNYLCTPDCEVVAVAELRPRLRALVAQRYGISSQYADHREMIATERLDGIVAVQQYTVHGCLVPDLLAARVPVLIEKPLARSSAVADQLVAASRASGGSIFVGYHKRSDPATAFARRQIREWQMNAAVGRMRYVRITVPQGDWCAAGFAHHLSTDEPPAPTTIDAPPADLDVVLAKEHDQLVNGAVHQLNFLRFMFGERYAITSFDPTGVLMAAQSESGIPGAIEFAPYRCSNGWHERIVVCFERGYVRIDLPAPLALNRAGRVAVFTDADDGSARSEPDLPPLHAMRVQAANFVRACRGEPTDLCTVEEAADDIHLVDRCIALTAAHREARAFETTGSRN